MKPAAGRRANPGEPGRGTIRRLSTADLSAAEIDAIRDLLWAAFAADDEGFTEDDWQHSVGGRHVLLEVDRTIVCHASVVERTLHVDGTALRTGYVEAVATAPGREGLGFGSRVMGEVSSWIRASYELGALGTGRHHFYERLGWQRWRGPMALRTDDGLDPTPEDDGYLMVLATPSTPPLDLDGSIACEWRSGDVW